MSGKIWLIRKARVGLAVFVDAFEKVEASEDAAVVFGKAGGGGALVCDGAADREVPDVVFFGGAWAGAPRWGGLWGRFRGCGCAMLP